MAQQGLEDLCCSICLDLLEDPVTLSCGHNYCMSCIDSHWDGEKKQGVHSCPQCRKTFMPRPVLGKNTVLANLVEERKTTTLQTAPVYENCQNYTSSEDVACDFCTDSKLKAIKSCLQCLASYCELHLQPHYESPNFQKHKLVKATPKFLESVCSVHNKVKEVFCRSDQLCICYLCAMNEHKFHNTVSAADERVARESELRAKRQTIQTNIQNREEGLELLRQKVETVNNSAEEAVRDSRNMLDELVQLLDKKISEVQQQIQAQQETEMSQIRELQEKLQQEIAELRKKDAELEQLSGTEDHSEFLLSYSSLAQVSESMPSPQISTSPQLSFKQVMSVVSEVRNKLEVTLNQAWTKVTPAEEYELPPEQPKVEVKEEPALAEEPLYLTVLEDPENSASQRPESVSLSSLQAQPRKKSLPSSGEAKNSATQQRYMPPSAESQTSMPQIPLSVLLRRISFKSLAEAKNSTPQLPHHTPVPPSPAESNVSVPQQPVYMPPPLPLQPSAEPKIFMAQEPPAEPRTRGNRKVTYTKKEQHYANHPDRFRDSLQVLSRDCLLGRCYWEVKFSQFVSVAVAYKNISRVGSESGFGYNDKSWALWCHNNDFRYNCFSTAVSVGNCSKIGVYLDHDAGLLCFYSISTTSMTLIHKVQTTFTQPLYMGLWVCSGSAKLLQLK
ncbi:E3 ubiquitin/ISG15 ligase TRIM25-like [Pholidichthys leucotaenia]